MSCKLKNKYLKKNKLNKLKFLKMLFSCKRIAYCFRDLKKCRVMIKATDQKEKTRTKEHALGVDYERLSNTPKETSP